MNNVTSFWKRMISAGSLLAGVTLASAGPAQEKTAKPKPYPLKTCIVSGEKLGEMGKPHVFTYQGQEIKFCCKGCLKDFNQEPEKYLTKLAEAESAKGKTDHGSSKSHDDHSGHWR